MLVDPDGRFVLSYLLKMAYKAVTSFFKNDLKSYVNNNETLKSALMEIGGCTNEEQLNDILTYNQKGPMVDVSGDYESPTMPFGQYLSSTNSNDPDKILINNAVLDLANQVLNNEKSTKLEKDAAILMVFSTYLHESVHYMRDKNNKTKEVGYFEYDDDLGGNASFEAGEFFEFKAWGKVFKAGSLSMMPFKDAKDSKVRARLVFEEAKQYLKDKQENNNNNGN
jgi:hypothetical protein